MPSITAKFNSFTALAKSNHLHKILILLLSSVMAAAIANASQLDQSVADGLWTLIPVDLDGDQRTELLWQGQRKEDEHHTILNAVSAAKTQRWHDGFLQQIWNSSDTVLIPGDFTGDASTDFIVQSRHPFDLTQVVHTFANGRLGVPVQSFGERYLGEQWSAQDAELIVGDYDGDNRDDIFVYSKHSGNRHALALADEKGLFNQLALDFDSGWLGLNWSPDKTRIVSGDFNGDGRHELLLQPSQSDGVVYTVGSLYSESPLSRITQQFSAQYLNIDWGFNRHRAVVGDFSGDKRDDVILLAATELDDSYLVQSDEHGLKQVVRRFGAIPHREKLRDIVVGDFDGDGREELILFFNDAQQPARLLAIDESHASAIEASLRSQGVLTAKQTLAIQTGFAVSAFATGSGADSRNGTSGAQASARAGNTVNPNTCLISGNGCGDPCGDCGSDGSDLSSGVQSPAPTWNEFGVTGGQFKVDESGAATYAYPIPVAPGSGGVAPKLALSYSSQSGNGPLGLGWGLSGLSAITRCRATFESDGFDDSLRFDALAQFCLDGQRLILKPGSTTVYHTEIDSVARVTAVDGVAGSPDYFTVERKDGSISYFGQTSLSSNQQPFNAKVVLAPAITGGADPGKVMSWAINKMTDSASNFIEYLYAVNDGEQRLDRIRYTGNARLGQQPYADVIFDYEPRPDTRTFYSYGGRNVSRNRVKGIRSLSDNVLQREIRLSYTPLGRSPLSRLEYIQECVGTTCLPALQLVWQAGLNRFSSTSPTRFDFTHRYVPGSAAPADFNGDGIADLGWLFRDSEADGANDFWFETNIATRSGADTAFSGTGTKIYLPHKDTKTWHLLDFNSDGRTDLLSPYCTAYGTWKGSDYCSRWNGTWAVALADANGYLVRMPQIDTGISTLGGDEAELADFDGNGLPDLLFPNDGGGISVSLLAKPGPNHVCQSSAATSAGMPYCFGTPKAVTRTVLTNLSGDLKSSENSGNGDAASIPSGFVTNAGYSVFDANGDGFADLLAMVNYSWVEHVKGTCPLPKMVSPNCTQDHDITHVESRLRLFASSWVNNVLTFTEVVKAAPQMNWIGTDPSFYRFADINGDGLTDVLYSETHDNIWRYALNTGDGYTPPAVVSTTAITNSYKIQLLDVNNDGLVDIAFPVGGLTWQVIFQRIDGSFGDQRNTLLPAVVSEDFSDVFADFNGDGSTDRLLLEHKDADSSENTEGYQWFYPSTDVGLARNIISEFRNVLGNVTHVDYKPLTDSSVYKKGSGAAALSSYGRGSPIMDLMGPMMVVASVKSSAPNAGVTPGSVDTTATSEIRYFYEGLRAQSGGRGSLGFSKLYTLDPQSWVETATTYRQDFPFIGMPSVTTKNYLKTPLRNNTTARWGSDFGTPTLLLQGSTTWLSRTTFLGGVMPYASLVDERSLDTDASNTVMLRTQTVSQYDDYGNATSVQIKHIDGAGSSSVLQTKTTTSTFPTGDDGFLGRLIRSVATTSRAGYSNETRTAAFEYDADNRQLRAEIIEPDSTNYSMYLRTEYTLDGFGNRTATRIRSNAAVASGNALFIDRIANIEYDSRGRFIDRKYNHFGQLVESVTQRDTWGRPTQILGLNGVTQSLHYTAMGRVDVDSNTLGGSQISTMTLCASSDCGSGISGLGAAFQTSATPNNAPASNRYFDLMGREILSSVVAFDGSPGAYVQKRTEYDRLGRVKRASLPYFSGVPAAGWDDNTYDNLGRVIKVAHADGTFATTTYSGLAIQFVNELGQSKTELHNRLGELVSVNDNLNNSVSYEYDVGGRLKTLYRVNGSGKQSILYYDKLGRKTGMWDADKSPGAADTTIPWTYTYNALGELLTQKDARGYTTSTTYDSLGRGVKRLEKSATGTVLSDARWTFDNSTATVNDGHNSRSALLKEQDLISGSLKTPTYDSFGRVTGSTTSIDGFSFTESASFDALGRPQTQTDASGYGLRFIYSPNFYVKEIQPRDDASKVLRRISIMDAFGHIVQESFGSGTVSTTRGFDVLTGRLTSLQSQNRNGAWLQDLDYVQDALGNLKNRDDSIANLHESLSYDGINRLKTSTLNNGITPSLTMDYDAEGNIRTKSDVKNTDGGISNYVYGTNAPSCTDANMVAAGPHAVSSVEGNDYCYDANGNQLRGKGRTLVYDTAFDLPTSIIGNKADGSLSHITAFVYAPNHSRIKRLDTGPADTLPTVTYHIGSVDIIKKPGATTTEFRRNLGFAVNAVTRRNSDNGFVSGDFSYMLNDHLGSTDVITDSNGVELSGQRFSFDAFGKQRDTKPNIGWKSYWSDWRNMPTAITMLSPQSNAKTLYGFTGHEQLDELGLIHMNGRVYDPHLGRFIQADPTIQAPSNSQSLNRYSYILNNPLSGTDPSGFTWWMDHRQDAKGVIIAIIAIIIAIYCEPCGASFWAAFATGAAIGFAAHVIMTGSTRGAWKSALIGGIAGGIAYGFSPNACTACYTSAGVMTTTATVARIAAMATWGGTSSYLQGGKFGNGFAAAALSSWASSAMQGMGNAYVRVFAAAVVGGTASAITGGKFANGAITGAFAATMMEMARPVQGEEYKASDATPDGISDGVKVNGYLKKYGKISFSDDANGRHIIISLSVYGDNVSDKDMRAFVNQVSEVWNAGLKSGGASISVETQVTIASSADSADIRISCCSINGRAYAPAGGRNIVLNSDWEKGHLVGAHEFGHVLGLYHQDNPTESIMSYSSRSSLHYNDLNRLYSGYH